MIAGTERKPLGFGLVALVKVSSDPRVEPVKVEAEEIKKCKCGGALSDRDSLTRDFCGVREVFYYCRKCQLYHNPETGRRFGTRW